MYSPQGKFLTDNTWVQYSTSGSNDNEIIDGHITFSRTDRYVGVPNTATCILELKKYYAYQYGVFKCIKITATS